MTPVRRVEDFDPGITARDVLVVADDLAGAAESAAGLTSWSPTSCELRLVGTEPAPTPSTALVIDTDSRYLPGPQARERLREALDARTDVALVLKKVDSLLRGQIADEAAELSAAGRHVIASLALPALGRTVVGGVVRLDGVPLHETDAWAAERALPPHSVSSIFDAPPGRLVPLAVVRSSGFDDDLIRAIENGGTPVCDAEDQADLDRIVDAAIRLSSRYRLALMGTGALARALGKRLTPTGDRLPPMPPPSDTPLLVVVGTLAASAVTQVERLVAAGAEPVLVTPADLVDDRALRELTGRVWRALGRGVAVVSLDRETRWHRDQVARLATALPTALDPHGTDLVLTGGETARRVLDVLGVTTIHPLAELDDGAVLSIMPDGHSVVTRPGSFGSPDSLVEIVGRLRGEFAAAHREHR